MGKVKGTYLKHRELCLSAAKPCESFLILAAVTGLCSSMVIVVEGEAGSLLIVKLDRFFSSSIKKII